MDKRKIFGTIIGIIFWSFCVIFFTYAYYDWRSDPTNIVLGIEDLSLECLVGADVEVSNIGPVLNYQDGVKTEFSINNAMTDNMTIELYLDITSISDNLLTDSLKYALVADSTGGTNYDYNNPLLEGDFSNFNIGNNLITQDLEVISEITTNYQFIIYIDGNMYNGSNMQENSLVGNLLIGKCSGDSVPYDELVYQAIYSETDNSLTFVHTTPLTVGDTYNDKAVTAVYTGFDTTTYVSQNYVPWYKDGNNQNITTVNFHSVIKPKSTAYWFYNFDGIENLDLSKLNTTDTINMKFMVYSCNNLINVEFSDFSTSKVTTMDDMFNGCNSLVGLDLSNFNTSSVTSMGRMFKGCSSLTNLDLSSFNTSKVQWVNDIFNGCSSLTELDLSNWDTSKVTTMANMFYGCYKFEELDLSNFDTSNVNNMSCMFSAIGYNSMSLKKIDISNFNTSNVTNMYQMFYGCSNLEKIDVSKFNTSKVTDMSAMFKRCSSLTELDVSNWDTKNVTKMGWCYIWSGIFSGCSNLEKLDVSNWDTSNVTEMGMMFNGCSKLTELDVSNFDTSKVTTMGGMFSECSSLTSLDVSNFDTSSVKIMGGSRYYSYGMFQGCSNLISLDLSNFGTSNVTNMDSMFYGCTGLISLDVSKFNTSNVTIMSDMFNGCRCLNNLDVSNFDTSKVTNMAWMFYNCNKLTTTVTIKNTSTTYSNMFLYAATAKDSDGNYIGHITINYIPDDPTTSDIDESTETIVDAMIATKSNNSNIEKGCFGDNCPIINT